MFRLVYALDSLALVRAAVVGLERLELPRSALHLAVPPPADDRSDRARAAGATLRSLLAAGSDDALAPYHTTVSEGRCVLAVDVPDAQLPNVELLFAAFRDDAERLAASADPASSLSTAA